MNYPSYFKWKESNFQAQFYAKKVNEISFLVIRVTYDIEISTHYFNIYHCHPTTFPLFKTPIASDQTEFDEMLKKLIAQIKELLEE